MTIYHEIETPDEDSFPNEMYNQVGEYIDDLFSEKEVWGRLLQLDSELRSLRENYVTLDQFCDNPEEALNHEEAVIDDIYQVSELNEFEYNPMELDSDVEEQISELLDFEENIDDNYLNERNQLDTMALLKDIRDVKENGAYDQFKDLIYENLIVANKLNNAVSEAVRREGCSPETPEHPETEDGLRRFLREYTERHEEIADRRSEIADSLTDTRQSIENTAERSETVLEETESDPFEGIR